MIVVDASVWVSHLVAQDIHHTISRQWLTARIREGEVIVAPAILLAEVAGAIARRSGDSTLGHKALDHILSTPDLRLVDLDQTLSVTAAEIAFTYKVRGADAFYIAVAWQLDVPLLSWDQQQIQRASELVLARTPAHP
jgi:predicted nucleic acid-binding protein